MAEDSGKKKSNSTVMLAGALVLGAVVGAAVSSGSDDEVKALKEDLAALEETIAEQAAAAEATLAEELELKASAMTKTTDYLNQRITELEDGIAAAAEEAAAIAQPVEDRVGVMAQQMAGIIGRLTALESGAGAEPADEADAPAAETAPAEAESGSDAESLAAAVGDDGAILSVGQTARFDDTVLFLSRIDSDAGAVRMIAVGQGPVMIGGDAGPFDIGGGCMLELLGVEDGKAYLKPAC